MAVLVTGGSGFVGLNAVEALLKRGKEVVVAAAVDVPSAARQALAALPGRLTVRLGDVRDGAWLSELFARSSIDGVIHAAVVTADMARERRDPRAIADVNLVGTIAVLAAARDAGVRRAVVPSSVAVYGRSAFSVDGQPPALDEAATCPWPESLYGITKWAAERASLRLAEVWGLDVVAARLGAVYGPWEWATGARDTLSPMWQASRLAAQSIEAVVAPAGTVDWVYSRDVARALLSLLDAPRLSERVYNVGTGRASRVHAWCDLLKTKFEGFRWREAATGEAANVDSYQQRDRAPLAVGRIERDTGFKAEFDQNRAFADFSAWLERTPGALGIG
jgi:nucleoside-diphosphate-sugar epimerase